MRIQTSVEQERARRIGAASVRRTLVAKFVTAACTVIAIAAIGCSSSTVETLVFGKKVAAAREAHRQAVASQAAAAATPTPAVQESVYRVDPASIAPAPSQVG